MTTDLDSDYDLVQVKFRVPKKLDEEFRRMVSRKWPKHSQGSLSLEYQLAMKMWLENDGRAAHTHKNTVLMEAENKPNFHTRKERKVVQVTNAGDNAVVSESIGKQRIRSKRSEKYAGMIKEVIILLENQGSISETKYLKDRQEYICERGVSQRVLEEAIKTVTGYIDTRPRGPIEKRLNELVFSGKFVRITKTLFEVK